MVYFTYGTIKSASTYCDFLVRQIFIKYTESTKKKYVQLKEIDQRLGYYWIDERYYNLDNFLSLVKSKLELKTDFLVAKTHEPITPNIRKALCDNCFACATFRHPADMVLSLFDAAKLDSQRGVKRFDGIRSLEIALKVIDDHIYRFNGWKAAGAIPISFPELTLQPSAVIKKICDQVGIYVDPDVVLGAMPDKKTLPEFNIGRQNRRNFELEKDILEYICNKYSDFIKENNL